MKRCESKVERLRATHMLANHLSIAISAMSVKRESIFSKKLSPDAGERARARDGAPRLCISLSHLRISSSQRCISLSQQRDSCSYAREQLIHEKVVPLSEKPYHFSKTPTTFPPLQLSRHWDSLSRYWLQLSRVRISYILYYPGQSEGSVPLIALNTSVSSSMAMISMSR